MANVKALALSARAKLDRGDAISEVDAISKAITGAGIRDKADRKRLMRDVGRQFARNKHDEQRTVKRRA